MGKHISRFARGAIMILKQMNFPLGESKEILEEMGFELNRIQLKYVRLYSQRSQNKIRTKIFVEQKNRGEQLNEDQKRRIIQMFSQNNAKSIKQASKELDIDAKFITAYLKNQNMQIKKNIQTENDKIDERYKLSNIQDRILTLLDEEPNWKPCIIRILMSKIKFGQIRQFQKYFQSLTSEVKYESIKFLGFEEGEKFFGRGSFIYIHAKYNPLIFISFSFLEKFLMRDIPIKFFSINPVIEVCRLKVLSADYLIQRQNKNQIKNLKNSNSQEEEEGEQNKENSEESNLYNFQNIREMENFDKSFFPPSQQAVLSKN